MKNQKQAAKVPAPAGVKEATVDAILEKVKVFQAQGELDLPVNYSAPNALKAAWLILQEVKDKNKDPVLQVCSKATIANSLLNMVVQGLNPIKKQCYFIAYGRALQLSPSYLGNMAVALRLNPHLKAIYSEVIYKGDKVLTSIVLGQRLIKEHTQDFDNIDIRKITGAYAIAVDRDNEPARTEIMNWAQIIQSWKQSQTHPVQNDGGLNQKSVHYKYTDQMCKRTAINRLCKYLISQSDDSTLALNKVKQAAVETANLLDQAEAEEEIEEHANQGQIIDISPGVTGHETKPAETQAAKPVPAGEPGPMTQDEMEQIEAAERAEVEVEQSPELTTSEARHAHEHTGHGGPPF